MVFVALGVPAVLVMIVRRYVPESPRWLEERGRHEDADRVMSKFEDKVRTAQGHSELPEPELLATALTERKSSSSFGELWSGQYRSRTLMLWGLWFFALLGYYGLTTWLGALLQQAGYAATKSVFYTVLMSLAGIPGFITSAYLLERWGRKATLVLMLLGSAVSAFLYGGTAAQMGSQTQLIAFGLCMQFFMFGMWSVLYAYTPELYPTRCRATGSGFASSIGRLGSLIGPFIVGVVLPVTGQTGVFSLGAACFVVASLIVLIFGVETKGKKLEEVST
jgi:putative MFS transporter